MSVSVKKLSDTRMDVRRVAVDLYNVVSFHDHIHWRTQTHTATTHGGPGDCY